MTKRVAGLLCLVVAIALGVTACSSPSSTSRDSEAVIVRDYVADFTVQVDGDLVVVETLTVEFPVLRHGIFRTFDTRGSHDADKKVAPEDLQITRDGEPEGVEIIKEDHGRYLTAKIGRQDTRIKDEHVYRISYTIPEATSEPTHFSWDLIPSGWLLPIDRSRLTVRLPSRAVAVTCAAGGSRSRCTVSGEGTMTLTFTTGELARNTPVTIEADFATAAGV
jgi:hypothetical protein